MKTTVFLGGGRITGALLAGLRRAKDRRRILVYDRHPQKLRKLCALYGIVPEPSLERAVAQADLLVIAVRPVSVGDLLRNIGRVSRPLPVVSLAAGIPFSKLRVGLGKPARWARAMPSSVSRSGRGLTALAFDRGFSTRARHEVTTMFAKMGTVLEIPESKFDAFTVTYSCSHGYHALATLARASRKLGLDRKTALLAATHALADGIVAWREGRASLDTLLHEAATPGGIAAAVMKSMNGAGYGRVVERGLGAGLARARKNSAHS